MPRNVLSIAIASSLLFTACGDDDPVAKPANDADRSQLCIDVNEPEDCDVCDFYGWYRDGECDDFCGREDVDCRLDGSVSDTSTDTPFDGSYVDGGATDMAEGKDADAAAPRSLTAEELAFFEEHGWLVAKGILRDLKEVTAYFRHRVTSGRIEAFNNQIARVIHRACGMTNLRHLFLKMRAQSLKQI